ncbi:hypothetical protein FB451DRAFT_1379821 [Mycena latifolia]|nr:hypothetical protein FB451DRAFT_1379821 [Mycena latifolia]
MVLPPSEIIVVGELAVRLRLKTCNIADPALLFEKETRSLPPAVISTNRGGGSPRSVLSELVFSSNLHQSAPASSVSFTEHGAEQASLEHRSSHRVVGIPCEFKGEPVVRPPPGGIFVLLVQPNACLFIPSHGVYADGCNTGPENIQPNAKQRDSAEGGAERFNRMRPKAGGLRGGGSRWDSIGLAGTSVTPRTNPRMSEVKASGTGRVTAVWSSRSRKDPRRRKVDGSPAAAQMELWTTEQADECEPGPRGRGIDGEGRES